MVQMESEAEVEAESDWACAEVRQDRDKAGTKQKETAVIARLRQKQVC